MKICPQCSYPNPDTRDDCFKCASSLFVDPPVVQTVAEPIDNKITRDMSTMVLGTLMTIIFLPLFICNMWALMDSQYTQGFFGALIFGVLLRYSIMLVGQRQGHCPYCKTTVIVDTKARNKGGVTCKACNQRILIKDGKLYEIMK